jgi:hypothetical protein
MCGTALGQPATDTPRRTDRGRAGPVTQLNRGCLADVLRKRARRPSARGRSPREPHSSHRAFLDAIGASVFVVSSGPKTYSGVVLPDADVIAELEARGQLFRTDVDDAACGANAAKIGPDADGQPGGCDNIRVLVGGTPPVQVSVVEGADPP